MKFVITVMLSLFINLTFTFAQTGHEHGSHIHDSGMHMEMTEDDNQNKDDLGICPVMGGKAKHQYSHTY